MSKKQDVEKYRKCRIHFNPYGQHPKGLGYLVYFVLLWYVVSRKIWQP
jgi:hypothetical protein